MTPVVGIERRTGKFITPDLCVARIGGWQFITGERVISPDGRATAIDFRAAMTDKDIVQVDFRIPTGDLEDKRIDHVFKVQPCPLVNQVGKVNGNPAPVADTVLRR